MRFSAAAVLVLVAGCDPRSSQTVESIHGDALLSTSDSKLKYVISAEIEPAASTVRVDFTSGSFKKSEHTDDAGRASLRVPVSEVEGDVLTIAAGSVTADVSLDFEPKLTLTDAAKRAAEKGGGTLGWSVSGPLGNFPDVPWAGGKGAIKLSGIVGLEINGEEVNAPPRGALIPLEIPTAVAESLDLVKVLDRELEPEAAGYEIALSARLPTGKENAYTLQVQVKNPSQLVAAVEKRLSALDAGQLLSDPVDDDEVSILTLSHSVVGPAKTIAELDYYTRFGATTGERPGGKCNYERRGSVPVVVVDSEVEVVSTRDGKVAATKVFKGSKQKCPFTLPPNDSTVRMGPSFTPISRWLKSERKKLG